MSNHLSRDSDEVGAYCAEAATCRESAGTYGGRIPQAEKQNCDVAAAVCVQHVLYTLTPGSVLQNRGLNN